MGERIQLWSCGGGRQSAGIAAMIALGELPPPDHACMTRLEWEVVRVWPYVTAYIIPALAAKGVPFKAIERRDYATKDFFGGEDGKTPLMPVYTNQSGKIAKLSEWCSGEWKREVSLRWAAGQPGWKAQGVDNWVGISWDERDRVRAPRRQWLKPTYPLVERCITVSACLDAVERIGWPSPTRSRCHHCPNQSDGEWAELTPEEWEAACQTDEYLRSIDPHAYLHRSATPLRLVTLEPEKDNGGLFGGCTSGMCY